MTNFVSISGGTFTTVTGVEQSIIEAPTLSTAVQVGTFVYYDASGAQWDLFDRVGGGTTKSVLGLGIVDGNFNIVTKGRATGLINLIAGSFYYANEGEEGGITTTVGNIKIGFAESSTVMLVNIHVESTGKTSDYTESSGPPTSIAGYAAGDTPAATTCYKITFSSGDIASNGSALAEAKTACGRAGDPNNPGYAYIAGSELDTHVDRITYSNDNISANSSELNTASRNYWTGFGDGSTYGVITGGVASDVELITFSNSYIADNDSTLDVAWRSESASLGDTEMYGYFCAGHTGATTADISRYVFSSTNVEASTSDLTVSKVGLSGCGCGDSNTVGYGYVCGGYSGAYVVTVERMTFSNSNVAANGSDIATAKIFSGCTGDSVTYGYNTGGHTGAGGGITEVDRITFSNSYVAVNDSALPAEIRYHNAVSVEG